MERPQIRRAKTGIRGMARSSAAVEFEVGGEQEMTGVGDPVRAGGED